MEYILGAIVIFLILCPPKYDPAIRLKERQEKQRKDRGYE